MKKLLIISMLLLTSCSAPVQPEAGEMDTATGSIIAGNVAEKGANLSIRFHFDKAFNTKASSNGTAAAVVGDIQSAKLRLTTSNTDPLAPANLKFTSTVLAFSGTSQTYTFTNVPAGTYYATVELYSDAGGTTNIIEPVAYGGTTGTTGLTVSSNSSTVSAGYVVSFSNSATSFALAPALKNATGATLEADVTPTNGNTTPSGAIGAF